MQQPLKLRDWCLIGSLAFGLGLATPYIRTMFAETPTPAEQQEEDTAPITTDAFTINLLHAGLQTLPQDNLLLLPNSLGVLLKQMQALAEEAPAPLPLPEQYQNSSADIYEAACLFADVPYTPEAEASGVISTPFASDPATAIATVNNTLRAYTSPNLGQMITGDDISADTTLIATIALTCSAEWAPAIRRTDSKAADFFNANGSIPRIVFMQAQAQHYAEDPAGEWKAASIRLAGSRQHPKFPPCDLILIAPGKASARPFAAALSQEQFAAIRTALRASAAGCTVEFPRLEFGGAAISQTPLLQPLGLEKLLTSAAPFRKLSTKEPFALNAVQAKYHICFRESRNNSPATSEPQPALLRCEQPFLWFLMPLSSPLAPYAMGVVENL